MLKIARHGVKLPPQGMRPRRKQNVVRKEQYET